MLDIISIAALFLITLASAITCHLLAKKRGRRPVFWGVMGVVFGPFAIPVVFLLKKRESSQ